jgi:hypothetical protein
MLRFYLVLGVALGEDTSAMVDVAAVAAHYYSEPLQ